MEKAILYGPFIGEFGWEILRFCGVMMYKKNIEYKDSDIKHIVLTRKSRFDLYGKNADILIPLEIEDDYVKHFPNCFRLNGFNIKKYERIADYFKEKYSKRFKIKNHIYPDIRDGRFTRKNQYPIKHMSFEFNPREENYKLYNNFINKNDKRKLVALSPRFRKGFRRNWNHWREFYEMIHKDRFLTDNFNFILCGKEPEHVRDGRNRFLDMNDINFTENSSHVGILLLILKNSVLTVGSQSAIPNLSLLLQTEVLSFGNQKLYHTKTYNYRKTPIKFFESMKFDLDPNIFFKEMKSILKRKLVS